MMKHANRYTEYTIRRKLLKKESMTYISISTPYTENDIIMLQDLFLKPGFHGLKVKNIEAGRKIIDIFVRSLNYYHDIGCLSINDIALPSFMGDVFYELQEGSFLQDPYQNLEQYFLNNFDYDFLIIELIDSLKKHTWFNELQQHIVDLNIHKIVPIVSFIYEQE